MLVPVQPLMSTQTFRPVPLGAGISVGNVPCSFDRKAKLVIARQQLQLIEL
jgi:hypothetical protein